MTFPFADRGTLVDANNATQAGCYRIYGSASNIPSINYGVLTTFASTAYIIQLCNNVGQYQPSIWFRTRDSNNAWSSWAALN